MIKTGYVYILTNKYNTTLYIGVTSNLERRLYEHQNKLIDGFTKRYNLNKLVYFEQIEDIKSAILREKYLKGKKREYKNDLIESINPAWEDLGIKYGINSIRVDTEFFSRHFEHPSCHSERSFCHSDHSSRHSERSEESPALVILNGAKNLLTTQRPCDVSLIAQHDEKTEGENDL